MTTVISLKQQISLRNYTKNGHIARTEHDDCQCAG